jgi:hypothetical protein
MHYIWRMTGDDEAHNRAELARWFLEHDEVDEAAAALAPGDDLELGRSAALDLTAALSRRGLSASYEPRRLRVEAPASARDGAVESLVGDLAASARKPPARTAAAAATAKKTA